VAKIVNDEIKRGGKIVIRGKVRVKKEEAN